MSLGCAIGCLGSIPFGYVSDLGCAFRPILIMIAFTLIFAPLLLKTYRIFRIFGTKRISMVVIKDSQLALALLGFLFIDCLIIILWMSFANTRPIPKEVESTVGDNTYENICYSKFNQAFAVTVIVYKVLLLGVGLLLAYLSRNAPSLFNESKYITNSFFIFLMVVGLGMILQAVIDGQPDIIFAIRVVIICLSCVTVAFQFFLPKFYLLYTVKDEDIQGFQEPKSASNSRDYAASRVSNFDADDASDSGMSTSITLSQRVIDEFLTNGKLPDKVIELFSSIHKEAEALVKKSQTGFKVTLQDVKLLKDHSVDISTYYGLLDREMKQSSVATSAKTKVRNFRSTKTAVVNGSVIEEMEEEQKV